MPGKLSTVVRRGQLWESAADELRRGILSGALPIGHHLAESDLAESLGVSRWPIRQALRQLSLESLVEVRPNGRTVVLGLSRTRIAELYDVRLCLERHALELAVMRVADNQINDMRASLARMEEPAALRDAANFIRLDMQFHEQFFTVAGNRILGQLWKTIAPQLSTLLEIEIATVIEHYGLVDPRIRTVNDLHAEILNALAERDLTGAIERLEAHLGGAETILLDELLQRRLLGPEPGIDTHED